MLFAAGKEEESREWTQMNANAVDREHILLGKA
jgi:hypothetical protein